MNFEAKIKEIDILVQALGRWVYDRSQKGFSSPTLVQAGKLLEEYRNIVNENWKLNGGK